MEEFRVERENVKAAAVLAGELQGAVEEGGAALADEEAAHERSRRQMAQLQVR